MALTTQEKKNFILKGRNKIFRDSTILDKRIHPDYEERMKECSKIQNLILKIHKGEVIEVEEENYIRDFIKK